MKSWISKATMITCMVAIFLPLRALAFTNVTNDVSAGLVTTLTQGSGITIVGIPTVTAQANQTGQVIAPISPVPMGTVNLVPQVLPVPGIMLTTGNIAGAGGSLALPITSGDADVLATLQATAGYATTGTYDASSIQFSFTVPIGVTAVSMNLMFATNELIGGTSPDTAVVMVDGVNKAVFNNGQLLSNQNALFLFAPVLPALPGDIVTGYANVSELQTLVGLLNPLLVTHTVKIAIADNTLDTVDSAMILANFLGSTSSQDGFGVGDIFPPVIIPQADVIAQATGLTTAVNLGVPTVTDNVAVATTTAVPAGPYPLGLTPVTWSATDAAGNLATAIQNVTIIDTVFPILTPPANAQFPQLTPAGTAAADPAVAAWLASAVATDITGPPVVAHNAPVIIPPGPNLITFTATDRAGNITVATATITIGTPAPPPGVAIGGSGNRTGGCSINPTAGFDPTMILLLLLSMAYLSRKKVNIGKI